MKKIKFLGTAILAASLLFAGCSSPVEDVVTEEDTSVSLSPEETGSNSGTTNGGTTTGGSTTGGNSNGGSTGGSGSSGSGNSTGNRDVTNDGYEVEFTTRGNSSSFENGVYTISAVNANSSEWGNQIWLLNSNSMANLTAGDKVHVSITMESDKDVATVAFKDEFNHGSHSGTMITKALEANTPTVFDIYCIVPADYDNSNRLVIDLRGNEANTSLALSELNVEQLGNYAVESITVDPATKNIKENETVTFKVLDQYGFEIPEATVAITSTSSSSLAGKILTAASVDETVTVRASYESFEATATITVETITVATEPWGLDLTNDATNIGVLPLVNVSVWQGADTAPVVEEFAGRKAIKFNIPASYGWIGAAWQANPQVDKIDVSGYSTLTITFNDSAFAEGESLTDYNVKMLGGAEIPLKGTVSDPDEDGWKTITVSLSDYANAGVSLSGVGCINFADWKVGEPIDAAGNRANPGAGALYISEVSFNPASQE